MADKVFEQNNDFVRGSSEKLYLDSTTADVNFVFINHDEKVPALKANLSVSSPVFHTMFYGSLPEKGNISIVDATPDAFKEFLQFFYLSKVRLTSTNIFQVANLCKKYELDDGLKLCEAPMKSSLTINNMCTGYATAKLLEMETVIEYCEQQIKEKASDVLKSNDFMECNYQLLDKVLQLVSSKCSASDIVDACMAWAKAECERKKVKPTTANLKVELKSSFDRIPFAELDSDQFSRHTKAYKRFFVEDELEAMLLRMMSKKTKTNDSASVFHVLNCDRRMATTGKYGLFKLPYTSRFSSNTRLFLAEFFISDLYSLNSEIHVSVEISTNGEELTGEHMTFSNRTTHVDLSKPIVIEPHTEYDIIMRTENRNGVFFKKIPLAKIVEMRDDIKINFADDNGPIFGLVFHHPMAVDG